MTCATGVALQMKFKLIPLTCDNAASYAVLQFYASSANEIARKEGVKRNKFNEYIYTRNASHKCNEDAGMRAAPLATSTRTRCWQLTTKGKRKAPSITNAFIMKTLSPFIAALHKKFLIHFLY